MPKLTPWMPRLLVASFTAISILASSAWAQQAPAVRIRGTIETVDGNMLGIKTREGTDGQNILVKYKDGEKKVVVPPDTPIVTFVASDKSEVKPGAKLIIFGAAKKEDGTLEANRVNIGRDGITPPM